MFCGKCGAEINDGAKFCPKCGHECNIPTKSSENNISKNDKKTFNKDSLHLNINLKKLRNIIILCAVILLIAIVSTAVINIIKSRDVEYKSSINAGIDSTGKAYFFLDEEVVSFDGEYVYGCSTPDQTKFLLLDTDGKLIYYETKDSEPYEIASDVYDIEYVRDKGCYFDYEDDLVGQFIFKDKKLFDIKCADYVVANETMTAMYVDYDNNLFVYKEADSVLERLCSVSDYEETQLVGVSNDGTTPIWCIYEGDDLELYTLRKGIHERIKTFTNCDEYETAYVRYFNDGKDYIVYCTYKKDLLISDNGQLKETTLPGEVTYWPIYNQNFNYVDCEKDSVETLYFVVEKGDNYHLCSVDLDGKVNNLISGIEELDYISSDKAIYLTEKGDVKYTEIKDNAVVEEEIITTDAEYSCMTYDKKYQFIIKGGTLFYTKVKDKKHEMIRVGDVGEDYDIYIPQDKSKVIYYVVDNSEIKDSYITKGQLYKYEIGKSPEHICSDVINVKLIDDSEKIYILKYVNYEDLDEDGNDDIIADVESYEDGKQKLEVSNIIY